MARACASSFYPYRALRQEFNLDYGGDVNARARVCAAVIRSRRYIRASAKRETASARIRSPKDPARTFLERAAARARGFRRALHHTRLRERANIPVARARAQSASQVNAAG